MKPIILIGGGGHCKSVIDTAESAGFTIMGVLDQPEKVGKEILGYKCIGTDEDIPNYVSKADFVITVGQIKSSAIRHKIAQLVEKAGGKLATIIASDAYVSKYARVEEGSVILHKAFINAGAIIGKNCIINTMANIEHDVRIGDFCHISTGTMVNGEAVVGDDCFVGSRSVLYNCISLCKSVIIAAGSIVNKDVAKPGVYAGNPIEFIK